MGGFADCVGGCWNARSRGVEKVEYDFLKPQDIFS